MRKLFLPLLLVLAVLWSAAPPAQAKTAGVLSGWDLIDYGTDTAVGNGYYTGTLGVVNGSTPFLSNGYQQIRFEAFITSLTNDGTAAVYQVNLDGYNANGDAVQSGSAGIQTSLSTAATGGSVVIWTSQPGAEQSQTTAGPPQQIEKTTWRGTYSKMAIHIFKQHFSAASIKWDLYGRR